MNVPYITKNENGWLTVEGIGDFSVFRTFDCGQCFRFDPVSDPTHKYEVEGIAHNKYVRFAENGDGKLYVYTGDAQPASNVTVPDVMGKNATVANVMITNSKLNILITGSTNSQNGSGPVVVSQSPAAGEKVPAGTVVTIELRYLDGTD